MRLDDFVGINHVSQGLGHGPAVGVENPAVSEDGAIRRHAVCAQGDQERTVKPAAVLVPGFQVDVRGPGKVRPMT